MDSKTQSELRRQKILANAEVRLRKIRRIILEDVDKEPGEQSQGCETSQNVIENGKLDPFEAAVNECAKQVQIEPLNKYTNELECENRLIQSSPLSNGSEHKLTEGQPEPLTNNILCNGSLSKSDSEFSTADEPNHQNSIDPQSFQNLESLFALSQSPKKLPAYFDIVIFVFLGILIRFLYFLGLSSVFQNNILGPFLVVCLPRMIVYIWQKPELPMVYSLIIFFGIPEKKLKTPFRVYSCLRTAIQYLVLYLFSFFVTHFVIKEVNL